MTIRSIIAAAVAAACLAAAPARAQAPQAPAPLAPANGAALEVPLTISWTGTLNPSDINGGYNWQVSASSTFSPLVLGDSTNPATTEDRVSGLVPGSYFWRVQAVNSAGQSAWSEPRSFVVTGAGPGTPGTPVLQPTQGYSTFHPWEVVRFHWSSVPDAVSYRLEVSNDPAFPVGPVPAGTITFWNDNIPSPSDSYVHTMTGNWFARVFAVDADNPDGIRSLPSNVIQFSCFFNNPLGPPPDLLAPIDNPTLTLPVTLTWAHVPNPQPSGYLLEVARDAGFTDVEWFFNQYTEPTTDMLSLTSGPKFWRVLSQHGLSSPTTAAFTAWSATGRFTISSAPATPVSIAPRGNPAMVMYSGASGMVAVQLTAGVPAAGATIPLTSSHPAIAPVPATISMPGTHAWAQFPFTVGQVTAPTVVTLTATLNGVSASNQFTLQPPTLNGEILQGAPVQATGGATMTGWVDLEGGGLAGPQGFTVALTSSSSAATVPATVTIPAGVGGTSFSIQTSSVATTTVVTITASSGGVSTSWPITLTPAPAPTALLVRPMSTTNGSQGVVTVSSGMGSDQLVAVTSSDPSLAAVPGTATVSAGSGIGFFNITTAPVQSPVTVTISVSGAGVTKSHPLTLYPSLPALTALSVSPTAVSGGTPATGTVTLAGPAPPVGVAVNLGSNQPLSASVPASVTIPGGASSATFPVTTFAGGATTVQLSAALDNVFQFAALGVSTPPPAPTLSTLGLNPANVTGGSSSTGTVTLSAAAPSGGAVVSLSDDSTAVSVPATVTVAAGATNASFTATTTSVAASTTATITASYGGTSRTASLTVNPGAPPVPSAPSLLSPANQATVAQPITFDWTDAANAATYTIQIDNSNNFTTPLTHTQSVNVSQVAISGLPAQQLFWRVRGVNSAGVAGPFSSVRRFTAQSPPAAPALSALAVTPSSVVGGSNASGTVTLTTAAGSGGFVVSLSSSNTAAAAVPASVTVAAGSSSASFTITTGAVTTSTAVTISAVAGSVTRTATLTVTPQSSGSLPAPTLLAPAHDARFSPGQTITFDWSDVAGAASYTIQIDDTESFSAPLTVSQTTTASQYTTNTLPTQRLWWRVRAVAASGTPGAWSSVRRVEVKN